MKTIIVNYLRSYVSKNRQTKVTQNLMRFSNLIRLAYFNSSNHDIRTNGESKILEKCYSLHVKNSSQPFVIFDVGANVGEWSQMALEICNKNCVIHLFEIVPATRDILKKNLGQRHNVIINESGLSNQEQELEIKYYPDENTGSSEFDLPWSVRSEMIKAKCVKGDDYILKNSIERINFLKIDVEGADYKVLEGFSHLLQEQKIDSIQFEYNKAAVLSKRFLKDFYSLLGKYGYDIGRVLPNMIDFSEYNLFEDENLLQSNFFAIRRELKDSHEYT